MNSLTKKLVIFALVMATIGAAGWFGRRAFKRSNVARLTEQASEFVEAKNWQSASLALRRALQIDPNSSKATQLMAELMDRLGAPSAIDWRARTAVLEPGSTEVRLAWAKSALRRNNFDAAKEALGGLAEPAKATAEFLKLQANLDASLGRTADAERHYQEALRLEPGDQVTAINLSSLGLNSTNETTAVAARAHLKEIASQTTNSVVRLIALGRLTMDAAYRKQIPEALAYSEALLKEPNIAIANKIDHLQFLRLAKDARYGPFLSELKLEVKDSPTGVHAVARWLTAAESPTNSLQWLGSLPVEVRTNQPVPQAFADCHILMKDWPALLSLVEQSEWAEEEYYRLALLSLAQRRTGQDLAGSGSWRKAFRLAVARLDHLNRLRQVAASAGWQDEQNEVLRHIVGAHPKERWALEALMGNYYQAKDTRAIQRVLREALKSDPTDVMLKNNLAYVCLLLQSDLPTAHALSQEAFDAAPSDPAVISTHAYSLFLQGRQDEAAALIEQLDADSLKKPTVAACYSLITAKAGDRQAATAPLAAAEAQAATMLPEEAELLRQARASL